MSLTEKLNALKERSRKNLQPEALAILHNATENLKKSGILKMTKKVGDKAPDFSLRGASGQTLGLDKLLEHGPLVLNFYRGKW
ncbi:MAG: hypothetical protein ACE5HO_16415 [bacterium]